jgi:GNAT superfamily N-acetyltransferase
MPTRELSPAEIDAVWPQLAPLLGEETESRRRRVQEMLAEAGPYCIALESAPGRVCGMAVADHFRNAWIFVDHVAAIREFIATDDVRDDLLAAIDARARLDEVNQLSRFISAGDPQLPWWLEHGFREYMAAFRHELTYTDPSAIDDVDHASPDGIHIRAVEDADADWPQLWPLFEALNQHHSALSRRPLNEQREENARRDLEQELSGGETLVMLAEVAGRAVATSTAELGPRHADGTRTGHRSRLFIEPAYRGRKIAPRFEARALRWFREHGVTHVERWIVAGNERPRAIWSARGYTADRLLLRKALRP